MFLTTSSYVFFDYKNAESDKPIVKEKGKALGLTGTLLLAPEGAARQFTPSKNGQKRFLGFRS
jgi:predicted sulfurtransferase